MKNEKGLISLYVLFGMLFLLVFVLSAYIGIRNKLKLEEYKNLEIQEIYSKNIDVVENIDFAPSYELIPIYNIHQFNVVGTGSYLKVNNKIYQCGIGMSYILKNDIIIDIDDDLKYKKVGFNDYKLNLPTYYIEDLSHEIYYYKDESYWKCIAYQKFTEENNSIVKNKTYLQNQFSIIGDYNINTNKCMMIWNDEDGNLGNIDIQKQTIKGNVNSINQIDVFNKNYSKVDKKSGEYYLFVNIGNSI